MSLPWMAAKIALRPVADLRPHAGNPLPEGLQIGEPGAGLHSHDDPRVRLDALDLQQQIKRGLTEVDDLGARLRVREPQSLGGGVEMLPFERHDLAEAASGQDEHADGDDGGGKLDALALHLAEHLADLPQFTGAEEPLPLLLGVFLDVLARVRPVGSASRFAARLNILETTSRHRLAS